METQIAKIDTKAAMPVTIIVEIPAFLFICICTLLDYIVTNQCSLT